MLSACLTSSVRSLTTCHAVDAAEHPSAAGSSAGGHSPAEPVPTSPTSAPAADVDALGSHTEAAEGGTASLSAHPSPLDDSALADELEPLHISSTAVPAPGPPTGEAAASPESANGTLSAANGVARQVDHERLFQEAVQQSGRNNNAINAAVPHKPGPFVEAQGLQSKSKSQQSKSRC